jgi:hypothetical protein
MMQAPGPQAGDWRDDFAEGKRAYAKRDFASASKLLSR